MAHMRKFIRTSDNEKITDNKGVSEFKGGGWATEMSEDVMWELYGTNPGPLTLRLRIAKPTFIGTPGNTYWEVYETIHLPPMATTRLKEWAVDNEDQFWFIEAQDAAGIWKPVTAGPENTSAGLRNDGSTLDVLWVKPQLVTFIINAFRFKGFPSQAEVLNDQQFDHARKAKDLDPEWTKLERK
jgi:hypothetical protein